MCSQVQSISFPKIIETNIDIYFVTSTSIFSTKGDLLDDDSISFSLPIDKEIMFKVEDMVLNFDGNSNYDLNLFEIDKTFTKEDDERINFFSRHIPNYKYNLVLSSEIRMRTFRNYEKATKFYNSQKSILSIIE